MMKYIVLFSLLFNSLAFAEAPTLHAEKKNLKISQMSVDISIVANIATTTMDITYYNPFDRDLTGEFTMPLSSGEEMSRYALEVDGKLREGVVINEVKARQTFEAVIRQKIDPGIANLTKGNSFETQIYPIPAKGYKRVVVATTKRLQGEYYNLPIHNQEPMNKFTLDVKILKSDAKQSVKLSEFNQINVTQDERAYAVHFQQENFSLKKPIKFLLPKMEQSDYQLFTETIDGQTYFYLHLKTPPLAQAPKKSPQKIAIYWDNSFSAENRDRDKELKLLESYLTSIKGVKTVSLTPFHYHSQKSKIFTIDQDTTALIDAIKSLKNDGATTMNALHFDPMSDEILLFSDGVNTIGDENVTIGSKPIYTITSSAGSNDTLLRKLSSKSNGEFINLESHNTQEALTLLSKDADKLLSFSYDKSAISDIYPATPRSVGKTLDVTGILKKPQTQLTLNYGNKEGITQKQTFTIIKKDDTPIARIWASQKIENLSLDAEKNKKSIKKLSQKYNILTKGSAFIVLDRVEDYVEHQITPPQELKLEYDKLIALKKAESKEDTKNIVTYNIERINKLKEWYKNPPKIEEESKAVEGDRAMRESNEARGDVTSMEASPVVTSVPWNLNEATAAEPTVVSGSPQEQEKSSIHILAWIPDAPYMKKLREVPLASFDKHYYEFKEQNKNRPAFYIEVADYLFKQKQHDKAVRVLSNIIELDLENPELLKVVANRLVDEKEYTLAIAIYQEIKALRPEEPQSYRDLAIAYTKNGQYQKALDIYSYILSKNWDRFDDIKDTILNEYNALITLHKKHLNLKGVNSEYIYPMPLDIRITVAWSSNENDIDLWVVDPNGEKCFYSHPNTKIGGKISRDFTQGYGPEEYSIKKAVKGFYTVYLNYFGDSRQSIAGPVTINATLTTHYSTTEEKSQNIMIQLDKTKDTMQIGVLEFGK